MKYKLGDEVYLKGVITSINSYAEINYLYEVKTADECVTAAERHLEPINKEEAPLCLRNVLARLRELPEHDRKVWMDEIMHEFANDYGSVKYTLGYEQGKFDGAVEAEKSNKVVIPQFVAKWIDYCKFTHVDLQHALVVGDVYFYNYANQKDFSKLKEFLETENNQELFARAWLDSYDVEQEKRYTVKIKGNLGQYLGRYYLNNEELTPQFIRTQQNDPSYFTKAELERTGFGWVFDCEGVEVQEVE
ncbi:DUF1642 domain-containing protein [Streptococcus constellatus]|uniref:DUF1642 domain-containing protein n=1 Tax=Streptococcus constellatus TaxID=76860 RepID=UPI002001003C|nr:DUF1642 domain-containing protein [Streptococcus constellatus]